jgi:histidyl-tRNA synthetase
LITEGVFPKNGEALVPTFDEMRKLFEYLTALKRIAKVSFDMSLARGLDYYTGLIFEIVLTDKTTELGSISGGGRYDNLIGMFCQHQIPSVGGSIGIERLFTILEGRFKDKARQNACEVLVATVGKVAVADKLAVLGDLWRGNIKAEVSLSLCRLSISKKPRLTSKLATLSTTPSPLFCGLVRKN